ncbi:MAG TPA: DegT/DnrJ/EryC1/StrS family aminotransferase [Ktedonobacteraceae bacterium]|nr:DegT/DnrJ/EryC1/StrS family aminotransferase [Ktedonobacteraceae bacterium]
MILIGRPLLGIEEETAILEVLAAGQLAQGERVAAFERRFAELCSVKEAVAVSSGTAALHLALIAHNIGPDDEVITTPFSFAATANTILLVGATPVFVDIEIDSYNLDPSLVEAAITPRTKAILPVHLYGNPCDMKRLVAIAKAHNLVLIEDACQAHAAAVNGKPVGSFSTGCFSFYPTKNMTTGEGGMVTTNDPAIAEHVRILRNHGQKERYCQVDLGYNLRMTEMQAALGLVQIEKLEKFTERRIANAAFLTEYLSEVVQTPTARPGYRHVYHQYTIRVPGKRDEWMKILHERGISTAIHYPLAIYQQPFYRASAHLYHISIPVETHIVEESEMKQMQLPVVETAAKQVLSLPVHPALSMDELKKIVKEVRALCA